MNTYQRKREFLFKWFEAFHISKGWSRYEFTSDILFSDEYLLQLLSSAIPGDFTPLDDEMTIPNASALSKAQLESKINANIEIKLFTALKLFFKERDLDLTEVLKQIRIKKQSNKLLEFKAWE